MSCPRACSVRVAQAPPWASGAAPARRSLGHHLSSHPPLPTARAEGHRGAGRLPLAQAECSGEASAGVAGFRARPWPGGTGLGGRREGQCPAGVARPQAAPFVPRGRQWRRILRGPVLGRCRLQRLPRDAGFPRMPDSRGAALLSLPEFQAAPEATTTTLPRDRL